MPHYVENYDRLYPKVWVSMSRSMTYYVENYDRLSQKYYWVSTKVCPKIWLRIYKSMTENVQKYDRVCLKVWLGMYIIVKNMSKCLTEYAQK